MDNDSEQRHLVGAIDLRYKPGVQAVCGFLCNEAYREGELSLAFLTRGCTSYPTARTKA
jgi:hypothetical protein